MGCAGVESPPAVALDVSMHYGIRCRNRHCISDWLQRGRFGVICSLDDHWRRFGNSVVVRMAAAAAKRRETCRNRGRGRAGSVDSATSDGNSDWGCAQACYRDGAAAARIECPNRAVVQPARFSSARADRGAPTMVAPTVAASADEDFKVVPPFECPTFDDVGGMESVKQQLRDTVGLVLAFPGEALEIKVAFNGILLFGPPGTGKTFMAKAAAGEYGCNFLSLGSVELISSFRGESAKKIARAFDVARANVPVIMFFDEFDAIGTRPGPATTFDR